MRILHAYPSMSCGGIEAMICNLANEMVKTHDVSVCTVFSPSDSDLFFSKLDKRVSVFTLDKKRAGFSLCEIFKIYTFIRSHNYDVVHLHGSFYYYIFSVFMLHRKVKFCYTVHSDAKMENAKWDNRLFTLKKLCFQRGFMKPITISDSSKASFTKLYGVDSCLIYNGIPRTGFVPSDDILSKYRLSDKTKLFLHIGRITEAKNQLGLCRVFNRLISDGEDVVLLIAGTKQDEKIYSSIAPYFSKRIVYLGERHDVIDLLKCSDAMCLSSIWEGLPITLLEAFSVGCIPICTPVGGIPDILNSGHNGFLSADVSEDSYYSAIKDFLALSDLQMNQIRMKCMESFERFDIRNVSEAYIQEYSR